MVGYRRLIIGNNVFYYKIGKSHAEIRRFDRTRICTPSYADLTGLSWDVIERGVHKKWLKITPATIRLHIEERYPKELAELL